MNTTPHRRFRLTVAMEADTREDLVSAVFNLATRIDRGEVTVGVCGGSHSGEIYELIEDPTKDHDTYHAELRAYLDARRAAK